MRRLLQLLLLLSAATAFVSAQITAPRVGLVRYSSGNVYPVYGVPGNYIVGQRLFDGVDALSSSEAGGLLARQGSLLLLDTNLAPLATSKGTGPDAVVAIEATATSAIAWLPARHTLVHWNGSALASVAVAEGVVTGQVQSVSKLDAERASLFSQAPGGALDETIVSLKSGGLVSRAALPASEGSVYRQDNSFLSLQNGQLVLATAATGTGKTMALRATSGWFERMSTNYAHLHGRPFGRDWLLHFAGDQFSIDELPLPAAEVSQSGAAQ